MKDFKEVNEIEKEGIKDFKELFNKNENINTSSDKEIIEAINAYRSLVDHLDNGGSLDNIDEGIIGNILGGVTGALVGPALGKAICKALGITKGIIYDMLTSRLVTTALGATIFGRNT